jgi:hypothetical protein
MLEIDNLDFIREEIRKGFSKFIVELYEHKDNEVIYYYSHKIIQDASDIYIIQDKESDKYKVKAVFRGTPNFNDDYIMKIYIDYAWEKYSFKFEREGRFGSYYMESQWIDKEELGETVVDMVIVSNDFSNHWLW